MCSNRTTPKHIAKNLSHLLSTPAKDSEGKNVCDNLAWFLNVSHKMAAHERSKLCWNPSVFPTPCPKRSRLHRGCEFVDPYK